MVSIKDVSLACGVSVATVSKALNDQKDVSEKTKARIKETARQMGYIPNSASRSLRMKHSYNIGILYEEESGSGLTHDFFASILESFKRTAELRGYDITFVNNNVHSETSMSYLERSRYRGFDGVMIACTDFDNDLIQELIASDIPTVTIDYKCEGTSAVMSDNEKGMRDLVQYAYSLGHRKIAYIHGMDSYVTRARVQSFSVTCAELGFKLRDIYMAEIPYRDTTAAYIATEEMLRAGILPTCVFYPDDLSVIGGMNCLLRYGLMIPDDISVAGFDGFKLGHYFDPPLTTFEQDCQSMGTEAAIQLIDLVENKDKTNEKTIVIPGKIYKGGTMDAPKSLK